jgi:hypothetical protein
MNTKTYTAVCRGHVFVRRGTWEQIQAVLADGFCVCRVGTADRDGVVTVTLGIVL